jgi:alkaline phosphatase
MKRILTTIAVLAILCLAASCTIAQAPENVIILISDGWSDNHIAATDYYESGQTGRQVYQQFPVAVEMTTHSADGDGYDSDRAWSDFDYVASGYTDSAAAGTALSTGEKTYNGAIGVDGEKNPLNHLMDVAEDHGRATGVVSSVEFAHATPASFVAHNESRNNYVQIAREMLCDSRMDLIMGCGHPYYDDNAVRLSEDSANTFKYVGGEDTWADLTSPDRLLGADADGDGIRDPWTYIESLTDFRALTTGSAPKRLCGVPRVYKTLQCNRSGKSIAPYSVELNEGVPTLAEMTAGALNVLDADEDGFVLMVEGGAVDWASHANDTARMIEEQIDFNDAVEAVVKWIEQNSSWNETLVIVTGDHECGYLCGSGTDPDAPRWKPISPVPAGHMPAVSWHSGSHTNALIPLFAKGPLAENLAAAADKNDPRRGAYLDNTDPAAIIINALRQN